MNNFGLLHVRGWTFMSFIKHTCYLQTAILSCLFFMCCQVQHLKAQVVINEILPTGTIELKNTGGSMVDVSGYWLCNFPNYQSISGSTLECGNTMLAPGGILAVNNFPTFNNTDGEMGLYTNSNFGSPAGMIDYLEWGSTGHTRSSVAVAAMIWTTGDFVPAFTAGSSLEYSGTGDGSASWTAATAPSICAENGGPACTAEGGEISGGPFEFCVGDGIADNASNITLTGNSGTNSAWVITDDALNILAIAATPEEVNFEQTGGGTCLIWHISFEDGLEGAAVGENAANLSGCFDLSNSITVIKNQVNGGEISGGPFEFCVGDGIADNATGVSLTGNTGTNSQWVITDEQGNILGLPPTPEAVNFEDAGGGICLIWHLSFEDGLEGAAVGNNAADLQGCFDLSNSITVIRNAVNGGELTGGPFEFCVGDGIPDNATGVSLTGNTGTNSAWVITDEALNILNIVTNPADVDFDAVSVGTYLIWHISFENGLMGAAVGENAANLSGCFDLSNPITVVLVTGPDCTPACTAEGGEISGGPFEFCVGDGIADNASNVTLTGNSGTNSAWVITDGALNILAITATPEEFNFEQSGGGTCLIWHISFEDGLMGAAVGENAANLSGCFDLSNSITVTKNQVNGGEITGGPFEFCVGDGIADNATGISLTGNTGTNSAWVITDDALNILNIVTNPADVDFDAAGAGTALIWHISFADGLMGAAVGENAANLSGCFDLSNPITVVLVTGPDCVPACTAEGGEISGGPFEFCIGDGIADNATGITLTGNSGTNSQWVVTDDQGNILGLPPTPEAVNFEDAGGGICLIWHLSFEDGLMGAAVGNNASQLEGCFDLSNPITVIRNAVNGGEITGGPFEFCIGDGIADNVSNITLTGNTGTNSQWVVTDDQGNILGLPPTPEAVNFEDAGGGICLIWHLSFEDGLEGAAVGNNAADLQGCFDLSNPITVVRNAVNGGEISGGPFEFCIGDGIADNATGVTLTGNTGTNSQWVITDDQGNILGLPPTPEAVNFEDAGGGICLIWHLSFEDGLEGAAIGNNAADLQGCFDLSNPITVIRNAVNGGEITGGPFAFCVGDGIADNVSNITLTGNTGTNSQWVITDDQGNILGLPPTPEAVNFEDAGGGICLIWHLSFEDGLEGAAVGNNAADLQGCFDLSNPITVVRNGVHGGTLTGGPYTFCVGDGVADFATGITLIGDEGSISQWVVTDDQGNILALPSSPEAVNFDTSPAGTCLIWHLSFEDGLMGAAVGNNAADLQGCFSLSNPITVNRLAPDNPACGGGTNYVLVGLDELDMERNFVFLGGVGVVDANGEAEISEESEVTANGTFIRADEVLINSGTKANNVHAIPAEPMLPDFMENNNPVGNDLEVNVGAGETVTLTESIYEDINVDDGGTVIFSGQGTVYIEDFETEENVTVLFDQCTELVMSGRFTLDYDNTFNPTQHDVFVFADGDASIRPGTTIYGVVYTDEKLNIRQGSFEQQTYLYGLFIGEEVRSRDYANYWYQFFAPCDNIINPGNNLQSQEDDQAAAQQRSDEANITTVLSIYPNPAKEVAYIRISETVQQDVTVAIYTATNQLVSTKMNINSTQGEVAIHVKGLPAGVYFVKAVLENGESFTEKLIIAVEK